MHTKPRVALYCRVSTNDQTCENQLRELRAYCTARQWTIAAEYIDAGISGAQESRPALDQMMQAARRRKVDAILVWRLDRLGRSLQHLVGLITEITGIGIQFHSLNENIDTTSPAGRLQLHLLAAFSEFERERIRERVNLGIARAHAQGKRSGRRRTSPLPNGAPQNLTVREAARLWGCSAAQACRRLKAGQLPPVVTAA